MENADSFRKKKTLKNNLFLDTTSDSEFRKIITDHLIGEDTIVIYTGPQSLANTVVVQHILDTLPYKIANSGNVIWVPVRIEFILLSLLLILFMTIYFLSD